MRNILLIFILSFVYLEASINLTKDELRYLENKKEIKMCIDPDWMPFEKIENGKHIGLASEYMKIIEDNIGIAIKLVITKDWNESVKKAKNRECDIFSMVPIIEKRKKYMDFTSPYLKIPMVIATQNRTPYIESITAIVNVKIGIVNGYSISTILKNKYPDINIIPVESIDDGLRKVESGEIFAFIDNLATIDYKIQKEFISTLKVSGRVDINLEYRVATRNDEPILNTIFEKIIVGIDRHTKEEIFAKWIQHHEKETIVDYAILLYVSLIFFIIISIISYFYIKQGKLKREIEKLNYILEDRIHQEVLKSLKQKQLLEQQTKMAQMGEMIGAIAHQWRQPLNTVFLGIQNLKYDYKDGKLNNEKYIEEFISENKEVIDFMSKTIDDFRNFFRVDKEKINFNIKETIQSVITMLSAQITQNSIKITIIGDEFEYYGLQSEYQQVILNIINNAKDILVEESIANPKIDIVIEKNKITIEDNAGGIPQDILMRVFEPYFTTKEQGKGTGMGLYMSKMIIEDNMGGKLSVENGINGAKFIIDLEMD